MIKVNNLAKVFGAKRAVDEYFDEQAEPLLLHRIDYTGRIAIKH